MRAFLVSVILLAMMGCGKKTNDADRAVKLEQVRAAAAKRASPEDHDVFAGAKVILQVQDMPLSVVGLRVPLKGTSNAVFVTFEVDHFDAYSVEQLATEAIEDYTRAKNDQRSSE